MTSATATAKRIVLTGIGHWFPENVLDNQFFDSLDIGSSAQWIDERVGIKERRSVLPREEIMRLRRGEVSRAELVEAGKVMTMAKMSAEPWKMALQRAKAQERGVRVDQVIAGTSVPDWDIPANACMVAGELGIEAPAFDVNSACSTFVVNLHVARGLMLSGAATTVGIFNAERYTTRVDYRDRSTCVLFGDSAASSLLESGPDAQGLELIDTIVHSSPAGYQHVRLPDGGVFAQNGAAVQKFAVTKTVAVTLEILAKNKIDREDVGVFIGHQANFRMLASCIERNGLTDREHRYNVDTKGNQGATGAPTVLSTHWDEYKQGQYVVVAVVGSGLTWGAALFRRT